VSKTAGNNLSKIAVIGSGQVGQVLAAGFKHYGHEVVIASRSPEKLAGWQAEAGAGIQATTFVEAARFAQIVVLAVKGSIAQEVIKDLAPHLAGKVVLDATNPIEAAPPQKGVLKFFTDLNKSLMETLQETAPEAHFVKAFSCVGNALMVNPDLPGGPPTMFIAGNNKEAKATATGLLDQFGWETEDMGPAEAARAIEPLCMLWCIPGFAKNQWGHAFKMLKPD